MLVKNEKFNNKLNEKEELKYFLFNINLFIIDLFLIKLMSKVEYLIRK